MTIDEVLPAWDWRRRFGRYWRVIGPFSGITCREMLAAIKRGAEA
jgi:hypothetical protein